MELGRTCAAIDASAREFAEAIGFFFSLVLQAIVLFITKGASKQGTAASLSQLRDSLLFKKCPLLEPWLIKNFPRLRAEFVPLKWTILADDFPVPRIPNSSIPESMKIKVGERVFEVIRNPDKLDAEGKPIGPAMKHLGERAQVTESGPGLEQAMRDSDVKLHPKDATTWPKSEWSKAAQVDFPISSLASALDHAEAQLIFQMPQSHQAGGTQELGTADRHDKTGLESVPRCVHAPPQVVVSYFACRCRLRRVCF